MRPDEVEVDRGESFNGGDPALRWRTVRVGNADFRYESEIEQQGRAAGLSRELVQYPWMDEPEFMWLYHGETPERWGPERLVSVTEIERPIRAMGE